MDPHDARTISQLRDELAEAKDQLREVRSVVSRYPTDLLAKRIGRIVGTS